MPQALKPFRATLYNKERIEDFSDVTCPPYDVISKEDLRVLRNRSLFNFSRVLLAEKNDYPIKRKTFEDWLDRGVLVQDDKDSLYLYEQQYKLNSKKITRYGVISLLYMDKQAIFPHERTHQAPKEDRKKIIRVVEANLSPIFVIAAARLKVLKRVYNKYKSFKPFINCKDGDKNTNRLWKIQDPEDIKALCKDFSKAKLIIADGHHRFEISYDYYKKFKNKFKDLDYLMAFLTDCQKGLLIMPTHRIVNIKASDKEFFAQLEKYFTIKQVKQRNLEQKLKARDIFSFGIYRKKKTYFARLNSIKHLKKISNKLYQELDSYVFHRLVLPLFQIRGNIEYSHTIEEAKRITGEKRTAFFLRPADLDSVIKISSKGYKLPQKSTYFYPKLLSGLVVRRFSR
ncbi:MAG: DUF1015 domain-containing protein [Candidatus Omnitrophica bacterium]|nr:DUF1015 domain-containing protein [Candidatus Omnitrophota bacterium]